MSTQQIQVKLLRYKCIGCSYCVSLAPEIFSISVSDGKITFLFENAFDDDTIDAFFDSSIEPIAQQTENICPTGAIKCIMHKR
jgi:ferredoxin